MLALGVVALLLVAYILWLARRIARLDTRTAAALHALGDQLDRRAAAAEALPGEAAAGVRSAARAALGGGPADSDARQALESDLTRALRSAGRSLITVATDEPAGASEDLPVGPAMTRADEIRPAEVRSPLAGLLAENRRLSVARQVYNDAVRDTRSLRTARIPRAFRLGGRGPLPIYFDIDEIEIERILGAEQTIQVGP
jgi:hypothetical protein